MDSQVFSVVIAGAALVVAIANAIGGAFKEKKRDVKEISDLRTEVAVLSERVENETKLLEKLENKIEEIRKSL